MARLCMTIFGIAVATLCLLAVRDAFASAIAAVQFPLEHGSAFNPNLASGQ